MTRILIVACIACFAGLTSLTEYDILETAKKTNMQVVQAVGSTCQTLVGFCPLLDATGKPTALPLGTPCSCFGDPGYVRQ
jgi:hypothetical protein